VQRSFANHGFSRFCAGDAHASGCSLGPVRSRRSPRLDGAAILVVGWFMRRRRSSRDPFRERPPRELLVVAANRRRCARRPIVVLHLNTASFGLGGPRLSGAGTT